MLNEAKQTECNEILNEKKKTKTAEEKRTKEKRILYEAINPFFERTESETF